MAGQLSISVEHSNEELRVLRVYAMFRAMPAHILSPVEHHGGQWSPTTTVWRKPGAEPSPDVVLPVPLSRMCNSCPSSNARPVFGPSPLARKPPPSALTLCRHAHTPPRVGVTQQRRSPVYPRLGRVSNPPWHPGSHRVLPGSFRSSRRTPQ